jgi:hypothetical protein
MGWTAFDSDGKRLSRVVMKVDKIRIFLSKSDQNDFFKQLNFGFNCVEKIAAEINKLSPNSKILITVEDSCLNTLERSLSSHDINLIMWGDHAGSSPNVVGGITGVFVNINDWIYVDYDQNKGNYLRRGNPDLKDHEKPKEINIRAYEPFIKLINYGCYGNADINRERFKKAFWGDNSYQGKYTGRSNDREVILDVISDLLAIVKSNIKKFEIDPKQLESAFKPTLKEMVKEQEVKNMVNGKEVTFTHKYIDTELLSNKITEIENRLK